MPNIMRIGGGVVTQPFVRYGKVYFDGSTDYLTLADSADWDYGSGDFTIELKYRPSGVTAYDCFVGQNVIDGACKFDMGASGTHPRFTASANGPSICEYSVTAAQTFTAGVTYDLSVVRSGNSLYIFKDGVSLALTETLTISGKTLPNLTTVLAIGTDTYNTGRDINAYLYGVRITKGTGRYTANYTPPDHFVNDTNTVLCMNFAEAIGATTFIDETGKAVTTYGQAVIVA